MATLSPPPIKAKAALNGHSTLPTMSPDATPTVEWGNTAPLALSAFAVTVFMLSMVNAGAINPSVTPIVFAVALMFGGLAQFLAGILQFRIGKTFTGVVFAGFGAFWLSLFAYAQWFAKLVPPSQSGHALGLLLYAFGIFGVVLLIASFRSNVMVVVITVLVVSSLFLCAAGNYGAHAALIHWGGYTGLAVAALVFYLAAAELCEIVYGREVLPIWPLGKD
jgi:uncharacterized protein